MKDKTSYRHFSVIVAGDNPDELMAEYNANTKTEPRVKYRHEDASFLYEKYLETLTSMMKKANDEIKNVISKIYDNLKNEDVEEFFLGLAENENNEIDPETGDIITTTNPNGRWLHYRIGRNLSIPFKLKTGDGEVFSALKRDIDWSSIHLTNKSIYEAAWDMVVNKRKPMNEEEENIYENMKNRLAYFQSFKTKENYVISNTAFWAYAFLDENGWHAPEASTPQFDWMSKYYDKFIVPLDDNTKLTIFECSI